MLKFRAKTIDILIYDLSLTKSYLRKATENGYTKAAGHATEMNGCAGAIGPQVTLCGQ